MLNLRYVKSIKDFVNLIFNISNSNLDFFLAAFVVDDASKSYAAAMKSKDAKKWKQAACEEIEALLYNSTCEKLFQFRMFLLALKFTTQFGDLNKN